MFGIRGHWVSKGWLGFVVYGCHNVETKGEEGRGYNVSTIVGDRELTYSKPKAMSVFLVCEASFMRDCRTVKTCGIDVLRM